MKLDPRLKRGGAFALIFLLLAASLYGCAPAAPVNTPAQAQETHASSKESSTQTPPVQVLSAFTSIDLDGNDVTSDVFQNAKVTFVNIWGTFCGPCINEMPDLGELAEEYADKGVQFIGVVADASADTADEIELAKEIREETGASYLHILVSQSVYDAMLTGVSAIPTSFFVNDKGEIISETYVGSKTKAKWQAVIDGVLDAQGVQ
ncbi:MAG: TlpA disulfide reductase family protein [Clostridiaceae bacterium]|nr:TlpA family protein disulfide reductase [Eubacteriales bacterium]